MLVFPFVGKRQLSAIITGDLPELRRVTQPYRFHPLWRIR